jgi:hypothetical protein
LQPEMGVLEGEERAKLKGKLLHNAAEYSTLGYEIGEYELSLARFEVRRLHPFQQRFQTELLWVGLQTDAGSSSAFNSRSAPWHIDPSSSHIAFPAPAPPPSAQPLTTYSTSWPGYQLISSASPSASATTSWAPANPGKASKVRAVTATRSSHQRWLAKTRRRVCSQVRRSLEGEA